VSVARAARGVSTAVATEERAASCFRRVQRMACPGWAPARHDLCFAVSPSPTNLWRTISTLTSIEGGDGLTRSRFPARWRTHRPETHFHDSTLYLDNPTPNAEHHGLYATLEVVSHDNHILSQDNYGSRIRLDHEVIGIPEQSKRRQRTAQRCGVFCDVLRILSRFCGVKNEGLYGMISTRTRYIDSESTELGE
jgi:hypothetical protein